MSGTGAPWATLDDVRRMIEGSRVYRLHELDGYLPVRLVAPPPEHTDCPDSGPAKEAVQAVGTPPVNISAPQRETATGALSEADELRCVDDTTYTWAERLEAVRALVKREREAAVKQALEALGWMVAAHNDYRQDGQQRTFWLFTRGERAAKGEGATDAEALNQVRALLYAPEGKP